MVLWGTDNLKSEGVQIAQVARPDRRAPAVRRLRAALRRRTDPAGRTRPSADRRDRHALGHLPRPAAAPDPDDRRGRLAGRQRRRAARPATSSASTAWPTRQARLRPRDRRAARVLQCRGGIRRQRQHADRRRRVERSRRDRRSVRAPEGLCLWPHRHARRVMPNCSKTALAGVDLAYQNLDSVELGVTDIDHYVDALGGISRSITRAKGGTVGAGLYPRCHARRRQGPHAGRTGRSRNPHPDA